MRTIALTAVAMALGAAVAAPSCRPRQADERAEATDHGRPEAVADHADGAPALPLAGLRGIRLIAAPEPRAEGAWYPGEAIGDETAQAVLSSPVAGRVASPPAPPGRPVRRGDALLSIDSPELAELIARRLIATADAARAEAALTREETLSRAGATSEREVEEARREAAVTRAAVEASRLGLEARGLSDMERSGRFVLRAPVDGAVVGWNVRNGEGIEAGQDLGILQADSARLVRVDLSLPGPEWRLGDDTEARASDGRRWTARVVGVPSVLADDTRRLTFRLQLTGGALPLPGQPLEVRVPFAAAVILPQAAVQQIEGTWGVFIKAGETARFQAIRRGIELGSDVAILEGVHPGDEVVTDGAYLLKSLWLKAKSGGDDHDH